MTPSDGRNGEEEGEAMAWTSGTAQEKEDSNTADASTRGHAGDQTGKPNAGEIGKMLGKQCLLLLD